MKRLVILAALAVLTVGALGTAYARDENSNRRDVKATLSGFAETPSISTTGTGRLRLRIDSTNSTIAYDLSYSGLQGGNAAAAHLHLGQSGVAGGIIADLCSGAKPACPAATSATITGTITAANIVGPVAQGIAGPADWAEVLRAIRAGVVYANVHTAGYPGGEIRGQLKGGKS